MFSAAISARRGSCTRRFVRASTCAALLALAVPAAALPTTTLAATAAAAAQAVTRTGTLEVMVEDFQDHAITRHYLRTESGRIELKFKSPPTSLRGGTTLRVKGTLQGQYLYVDSTDSASLQPLTASASVAALPNTLGEQKTVVLLVNFQDRPADKPWTAATASAMVFGNVSDYLRENSNGQTWLSGAVHGWYTLPLNSTSCSTEDIAAKAEQAATSAGVNLSAYTRKVYVFPNTTACGFGGMASVGGLPSRAWINGYLEMYTLTHELGHNLGLNHAHSLDCGTSTLGPSCTQVEYGDTVDTMGGPDAGHYSAFAKELLGWLGAGSSPPITTASSSGTYILGAYEPAGTSVKALKILKSTDATTGRKTWYYLEYRQAIGFDSFLASRSNVSGRGDVTNGIVIRTGVESETNTSRLLNMNPVMDPYTGQVDWFNPGLKVGQSFTDAQTGITIAPLWADGSSIGVDVQLGTSTPSCVRAPPTLAVSGPAQAQQAGSSVTYSLTLTNKDSAACAASGFGVTRSLPSGWSGSLAANSLSLSPGASGTTTLTVTSPTSAAAGTYAIGVTATNSGATAYKATVSASYTVAAGWSASVTTSKASYARGETVSMTASVKSGSTPVAGASVAFRITKSNGAVVTLNATTNSSGVAIASLRLSKQKDPVGSYQLRADASKGSLSATASTSFGVQ